MSGNTFEGKRVGGGGKPLDGNRGDVVGFGLRVGIGYGIGVL